MLTTLAVCGIRRLIGTGEEKTDTLEEVIPIAGELKENGGGDMDAKWERLKTSPSHADSDKEGLRVELNGGFRELESGKRSQKAIIEFICDENRTGLENLYEPEDKYDEDTVKREESDAVEEDDSDSPSLQFFGYDENNGDVDILRLTWRTKYACENSKDEQDAEKAQHWGFFTWFIIVYAPSIFALSNVSSYLFQY